MQRMDKTLCKMILKKHIRSNIKQLCFEDEFSDYIKTRISKPLLLTQVLAVEQVRRYIGDRTKYTGIAGKWIFRFFIEVKT